MTEKKILVLGGKGKTGRKVAERLTKKGITVRIGSRTEKLPFDWEDPGTWAAAMEGMDAVYVTFQPDLAVPGAVEVIERFTAQAVKSRVQKLVLLSGRGEKEAQVCEQLVMNAGLDWTIVRASWFNQNFNESFLLDPILAGHVSLPRAEALEPFVDTDDIADVVVASLLDSSHNQQVYELTGPRLMSWQQAIEEISAATKRDIRFEPISIDEYIKMLREHQVPEDFLWLINYLFTEVLDGRNSSITEDIEKVLGRRPKDFTEYVRETGETGVWGPAG